MAKKGALRLTDEDAIKSLPGDLKRVAELLGLDAAITLVEHFGGGYLVIPKCDGILREIRNDEIRKLYDSGTYTLRDLAWKFRLTDRTIREILVGTGAEIHPLLFSFKNGSLG